MCLDMGLEINAATTSVKAIIARKIVAGQDFAKHTGNSPTAVSRLSPARGHFA